MHPTINIAISAARKAGDIIMRAQYRVSDIKFTEKTENDYVTEIDEKAELAIIDILRTAYPSHGILAEESGISEGDDEDENIWIIDPIDGTRNFLHGFPHFCVSIALQVKGKIEHGVIYDPVRQELFTASRGDGAFMNNKRMRVTNELKLNKSLIGCGFPFRHSEESKETY